MRMRSAVSLPARAGVTGDSVCRPRQRDLAAKFTLDLRRRPAEGDGMAKTVTIAARVHENLDAALAQLATATGRSKSALLAEALRSYVETEWPLVAALEAGLDVRRTGRFPGHRMAGGRAVRGRA